MEELRRCFALGIGLDLGTRDDERLERIVDRPLSFCAIEGGRVVATVGAYRFALSVPGGDVAAVGTTLVGTLPSHRRRGAMRTLLARQLEAARTAGCAVAALWASETPIYGRFGYGLAADRGDFRIEAKRARPLLQPGSGRIAIADPDEAAPTVKAIYARHRRDRAGMLSRTDAWWEARRFPDEPERRDGFGPRFFALYEGSSGFEGYIELNRKSVWSDGIPRDEVAIRELIGTDEARRALWSFALSIDLVELVSSANQPVDDVVPWLVEDRRRVALSVRDALWVRLLDVSTALSSRKYPVQGSLRIGIRPAPFSVVGVDEGTFHLEGGPTGARCVRADGPADVTLDLADLGSLTFGGYAVSGLAAAGRVDGSDEAIRRMDLMFRTARAPWCPERF